MCLSLRKRQSLFTFATPNNFYSAVSLSETVEKMLQMGCPCKQLYPVYVLSQTVLSLETILHHYSQKSKQQHLNVFGFFCILGCVVHLFVCVADILPRSPCAAHVYQFYASAGVVGVSAALYHIV